MSAPARQGVPLSYRDGTVMVEARPSEVPPDQLALLRQHKPELLPILAAFGTAMVEIRPATPIPDEPKLGDWVWSEPLPPRRPKTWSTRGVPPSAGWRGRGRNPNACVHCGEHVSPHLPGSILLPDGRYEHFDCWLRSDEDRRGGPK